MIIVLYYQTKIPIDFWNPDMLFGDKRLYPPNKQTNKKQQRKNIITTKRHERGGYSHVCNAETIVSGDVVFEDGGVIRNAAVDELRQ